MLKEHGCMDAVNIALERENIQEFGEGADGGWHTEGSLGQLPGWTP